MSDGLWQEIALEVASRRDLVIATVVRDAGSVPRATGAKMLIFSDGTTRGTVGGGVFESLVVRDGLAALKRKKSETRSYSFNPVGTTADSFGAVCGGRADVFLEVVLKREVLLIVGGGHCGRALAEAASHLDFAIIVADDRDEYARPDEFRFRNVERVIRASADFSELPEPDDATYVVLVSKGYVSDEAALRRVIHSDAAYIGMIGSRRKVDVVFENLLRSGVTREAIARVHAPVGIEIGADSPAEIAISILAEVIQARAARRGVSKKLSEVEAI